jgi:hypothetical protein
MIGSILLGGGVALAGFFLFFTNLGGNVLDSFAEDDSFAIACRLMLVRW